jgi:uncharacterized protein (DUF3820 family)
MTEQNDNIVPFGKYRGRLVEEVLADDPQYLEWLSGQDWFREKHLNLYQVIINRGFEPEETPEHNALQVLFLDDNFCRAFYSAWSGAPGIPKYWLEKLDAKKSWERSRCRSKIQEYEHSIQYKEKELESMRYEVKNRTGAADDWQIQYIGRLEREILFARRAIEGKKRIVAAIDIRGSSLEFSRDFENGVDVRLTIVLYVDALYDEVKCVIFDHNIEIKPVVGDDYPKVLRQMRASNSSVLFLERYTGSGATREQFIKTFGSAGIRVIFRDEVECQPQ